MHGAAEPDESWLGRTNWLWLIVNGLSTGVWRLIGWVTRKWPRHVTPGGLLVVLVLAAVTVGSLTLALSPDGTAGDLMAQATGALAAAALVDVVVIVHSATRRRSERERIRAPVRVLPRPHELQGRHRMMLVNDGDGPLLDVRISVNIARHGVTLRVGQRPRVSAQGSLEFDVINNDVATHLPFALDDELVVEWMDRHGDLHRREWRLADNMFWGYPVAFEGAADTEPTPPRRAVRSG